MATVRKSGQERKATADLSYENSISDAVEKGKSVSKQMENGNEEKVRMTAYLKENIHERLLRAITEEKIKQGKKGWSRRLRPQHLRAGCARRHPQPKLFKG